MVGLTMVVEEYTEHGLPIGVNEACGSGALLGEGTAFTSGTYKTTTKTSDEHQVIT